MRSYIQEYIALRKRALFYIFIEFIKIYLLMSDDEICCCCNFKMFTCKVNIVLKPMLHVGQNDEGDDNVLLLDPG